MNEKPLVVFLYIETENCADYGFDAYDEVDLWEFRNKTFIGKPLPAGWKLPRHTLGNPKLPLLDFVHGYFQAPFVSQQAVNILRDPIGAAAEFRTIGRLKGIEYYVMNVVLLAECLDLRRSGIKYSPDDPSRIIGIKPFIFDSNKIPDAAVFKVPQDPGRVFATQQLVDLVRKHRLTGVGFENPENIGIATINRVFDDLPLR